MPVIRLGTRGSLLARSQAALIADEIQVRCQLEVQTILITTTGDQIQDRPLYDAGGKGLFVKEIEQALLSNQIDFAVHSCKDVPVTMPLVDQSDLIIAAIPKRLDPRDVLISPHGSVIAHLPKNCIVGTSSLRRRSQLLHHRPDLQIKPIRGNIDTRIKKLNANEFGATILALAGLTRANLFNESQMHPISIDEMLPAPGQGALALQCRRNDKTTRDLLAQLNDPHSRIAVEAERAIVAALNCDCHSPIAVLAEIKNETLHITAALAERDGNPPLRQATAHSPLTQTSAAISEIVRTLSA